MDATLRTILTQLQKRFRRLYGDRLVRMVLYGSRARGDAEAGSDVDVLVVLKGDVQPCREIAATADDVAALSLERDVTIVCVFVSEEQFEHERSPLLLNVRREGVPV